MAPGEGQKEGVGFADGAVGSRLLIEQGLIAKIIAWIEFANRVHPLAQNLDAPFHNEIDPIGYLAWGEDFFIFIVVVFMQLLANGKQDLEIQFAKEA